MGLRVKVESGFYGWIRPGLSSFTLETWDGKGILIIRTVRFNAIRIKRLGVERDAGRFKWRERKGNNFSFS